VIYLYLDRLEAWMTSKGKGKMKNEKGAEERRQKLALVTNRLLPSLLHTSSFFIFHSSFPMNISAPFICRPRGTSLLALGLLLLAAWPIFFSR